MSKKQKRGKHARSRSSSLGQFFAVVLALFAALAVCGGTLYFRFYGGDWESGGSLGPLLTLHPDGTDSTAPRSDGAESTGDRTATETDTTVSPVTTDTPDTTRPPDDTTAADTTVTPDTTPVQTDTTANDDPEAMRHPPFVEPDPEPTVRVPESDAVEDSYFSDALFIGDSRTVGLSLYSGLKSNYYSQQGLNVSSVQKTAFIASGDTKLTLGEALDANTGFRKVYISFGINEIGWPSTQSFIDSYAALVALVREKLPDATIYVQEILPMARATAENDRYSAMGGNAKVAEYNEHLYTMCEEQGLYYIALTEIFADENGDLNVSDSGDGIHLGVASSKEWIRYLKTHTVA